MSVLNSCALKSNMASRVSFFELAIYVAVSGSDNFQVRVMTQHSWLHRGIHVFLLHHIVNVNLGNQREWTNFSSEFRDFHTKQREYKLEQINITYSVFQETQRKSRTSTVTSCNTVIATCGDLEAFNTKTFASLGANCDRAAYLFSVDSRTPFDTRTDHYSIT